MRETIFADNNRIRDTDIFSYPKLLLRLNEEFKDMKFKKVEYNSEIDKTTFKRDLTLIILPRIKEWNITHKELRYGTPEEQNFYNLLRAKKGYTGSFSYYRLRDDEPEPKEPIIYKFKVNGEQKSIIIGDYLYERNIVILYPNIFRSALSLLFKNEVLFFFVDLLKKWIKKNKIKKVNVNAKIQEMMFRQFRDNSVKRINDVRSSTNNNLQTIRTNNESIVRMIKENQDNKIVIEGLEELVKITISDLKKEINKIKKLPFVKSVKLTSSGINVEVTNVIIIHDKKEVKMGDYVISILPNRFKILAKKPLEIDDGTYHHPHISGSDGICFGGSRRTKINTLLAEMKFSKLVYLIYLFLKSYNHNDKYNPISLWIDGNDDGS